MERIASVGITKEHVPTTAEWLCGLTEMDTSRSKLAVLSIIAVIGVFLYFATGRSANQHGERARTVVGAKSSETEPKQFLGYECTVDCSGHEAGYRWAEEHHITDGEDCDTAGERSNSPSFAEGCHAYVDGESEPEGATDPDNEQ